MLVTNQRLDKLAAARVDYINRGMLDPNNPQHPGAVQVSASVTVAQAGRGNGSDDEDEGAELQPEAGPSVTLDLPARVHNMVTGNVTLARTRGKSYPLFRVSQPILIGFSCSLPLPTIPGGTRCPH